MMNSNSHFIRRTTVDDAPSLAKLGAKTFTDTFGHLYPPEDLQTFLSNTHSVDAWVRALEDHDRTVLVAVLDEPAPIGFVVVGRCKLPVENLEQTAGEIQQLYVLSEHQNLHLGSRLMQLALESLQAQGRTPIYIGVWSENYGARRFYARYGFTKVGEYGFRVGTTVDREFILKR
jgi:ribosomal protein S18 acetylase RimI-like enzyme